MESKKAQGISLNFIVIAIIAALVLIIIIAFTVGGLGTSLSKIFEAGDSGTEADIDLAEAKCEKLCNDAVQIKDAAAWENEDYCQQTFVIEGEQIHCWEDPVGQACYVSEQDVYGELWECAPSDCGNGCAPITCTGPTECAGLDHNDCLDLLDSGDNQLCDWTQ
ncbi:hypothetical protein HOD83_00395 [Candidatus Woesearchaeota archaeon]|nr:hypothetical protein [Candidatus Woesearchaeota archaeon]MBT4248036.1 hypothetical protein [Candidatus Woesearchaeota archaeon]